MLEDSRQRARARHELNYQESFSTEHVSRWHFKVEPGDYELQALITRCGGEQVEIELLSLPVDREHISRLLWLRLQEFDGETDITYVATSRWSSGADVLEIADSEGPDKVTLRNLSATPIQRCESSPYIDLEYEVEGRWVPYGSTKWPNGATYLDPDKPVEFRARRVVVRHFPPKEDKVRPSRKRYLVFYEPPRINDKMFDRLRDLGYVSSGSGCDIYYLTRESDDTDPDLVVPSDEEIYTYTF